MWAETEVIAWMVIKGCITSLVIHGPPGSRGAPVAVFRPPHYNQGSRVALGPPQPPGIRDPWQWRDVLRPQMLDGAPSARQAYYQFPHHHTLHGGATAMNSVAVR